MHSHLTACHECDLLIEVPELPASTNAKCPRCGYIVGRHKRNSVSRTLALSITAMILFVPANTLPILMLTLAGNTSVDTMFTGVTLMYESGFWLVAVVLCFCSIVIPIISTLLLFFICSCYRIASLQDAVRGALKFNSRLAPWSMLDVYMIGIITAVYKLMSLAELTPGMGLWCFVGLFLAVLGANLTFDPELIWEELENAAPAF